MTHNNYENDMRQQKIDMPISKVSRRYSHLT